MLYSMDDFEELASLAGESRRYFPSDPDKAVENFSDRYTHLIACLIVTNVWAYLEAEMLLKTGNRTDPLATTRKWKPSDFKLMQKHYKN